MADNSLQTTKQYLEELGLSKDEATLYLTLVKKGQLSTLDLSRHSGISRTQVYRLLEKLQDKGLVDQIIDEHRKLSAAVPPNQLKRLLQQKQHQLDHLNELFPEVENYINQQINRRQPDTQVLFFKGQDGIQQMAYNTLNAKTNVVGYTQTDFTKAVGKKFANLFYKEMHAQGIKMRDLISDNYIESIGGFNKLFPVNPYNNFKSRYISQDTLEITHTMDMYNDVLAIYNWHQGQIFGVEIHNPKVAKMQKQIFEILWSQATPEKEIKPLKK